MNTSTPSVVRVEEVEVSRKEPSATSASPRARVGDAGDDDDDAEEGGAEPGRRRC